jgi:hypothetical protein
VSVAAPSPEPSPPAGLDLPLTGLVLLAAGLSLAGPLAGIAGAPGLAGALVVLAGLAGTASFLLALVHTARHTPPARPRREETS